MNENSGDNEMENNKNNLPDAVKTNDAPSPVGNEIPTTPQSVLPLEKSMLEPPSFTSFQDQYIETSGKYIGQESPFFVSEELRSGKTPQITPSCTSPSLRQTSEELYSQLSPYTTKDSLQTRFQNNHRIDESAVIGIFPSSISQQEDRHVFRENDCNSQPLRDPSTPRLSNSNQPRFEHYIYSPRTSRDYPSLFSNPGEELISMMYLADGGLVTDFDSMRLESHNRVLFHPPKLESSPEPSTAPQPNGNEIEKYPAKTELSECVDDKPSTSSHCVLYRFRPEDQNINQPEDFSSIQNDSSMLSCSSHTINQTDMNSATQTKRNVMNERNSSLTETEPFVKERSESELHKRQERIQVTHFRFSDDHPQLSDHDQTNGKHDDDESYSNVENELDEERSNISISNSPSNRNKNTKGIGRKGVIKSLKEKQRSLPRVKRGRKRGDDDDYADDDDHEQNYEHERYRLTGIPPSGMRNVHYQHQHHHHHYSKGNEDEHKDDHYYDRVGTRRRSLPAKFLPLQSAVSSAMIVSTSSGNKNENHGNTTSVGWKNEENDDSVNGEELDSSSLSVVKNRGIKRMSQSLSNYGNSYEGNEMSEYSHQQNSQEDVTSGRLVMDRKTDISSASTSVHPCNCKKSRCLKLYCECFSADVYCNGCNCLNCQNNPEHHREREEARQQLLSRNSNAFKPKVVSDLQANRFNMRGCNCRKTGCLKKYCDCFQAGIPCGVNCRCQDCRNTVERSQAASRRAGKN